MAALVLALLAGCQSTQLLDYGTFLLEEGRYADAYGYLKDAHDLYSTQDTLSALTQCRRRWSRVLFDQARLKHDATLYQQAYALIVQANDLWPTTANTDFLVTLEDRERRRFQAEMTLARCRENKTWPQAFKQFETLLALSPFDPDLIAAFKAGKKAWFAQTLSQVEQHLQQGRIQPAYQALKQAQRIIGIFPAESLQAHAMPDLSAGLSAVALAKAERLLASLKDDALPGRKALILNFLSLADATKAAHKTDQLLMACTQAIQADRLTDAYALLKQAGSLRVMLSDLPIRMDQLKQRISRTVETHLQGAFFSDDLTRCIRLLKKIKAGGLPLDRDKYPQYAAKIQKRINHTLTSLLTRGLTGNALLLIADARPLFPDRLKRMQQSIEPDFLNTLPGVAITGPGAQEAAQWLRDAQVPLSEKGDLLKIHVDVPGLTMEHLKPSFGVEEKMVPQGLAAKPYPERARLLNALQQTRDMAARAAASGHASAGPVNAWERDFSAMEKAFWESRARDIALQVQRTPTVTHAFHWSQEKQTIAYYHLKATLALKVAFQPAAPEKADPQTLSVERIYAIKSRKILEHPEKAGLFPSKKAILAALKPALRKAFMDRLNGHLKLALKAQLDQAMAFAGMDQTDKAKELLCRIYAACPQESAECRKALTLLSQSYEGETLMILSPGSGKAGDFAEHQLPPPR